MNKQEYIQANRDWLKAKAQEDGVKALPHGIYYKVISEGRNNGVHPSPRSVVTAHYTGWTIDGKVFDSSRDENVPIAFRLNELIEGWISRCASATNGRYIFLPRWLTATILNREFQAARRLYSR